MNVALIPATTSVGSRLASPAAQRKRTGCSLGVLEILKAAGQHSKSIKVLPQAPGTTPTKLRLTTKGSKDQSCLRPNLDGSTQRRVFRESHCSEDRRSRT